MRKISRLQKNIYRVYVLILLVTFVSMFTSIAFSYLHVKEANKQANMRLFDNINSNVEQVISDVVEVYTHIINSQDIDAIIQVDSFQKYFNSPYALVFSNFLKSQKNETINYFIYLEKTDTIIAHDGVYKSDYYYNTIADNYNISYKEWINGLINSEYVVLPGKNNIDSVQYNMNYKRNGKLCVSAIINSNHILKTKTDKEWYTNCNVFIRERNGKTIIELNNSLSKGKKDIYTAKLMFFVTNAELVIEYPNSEFLSSMFGYWLVIGIVSILFVLLNILIAFFSAKKSYKPIGNIISQLGISESESQFEEISERIHSLLNEIELNHKISNEMIKIKKNKEIEEFILCLLKPRSYEYVVSKITNKNIININSEYFFFSIDTNDIENLFFDSNLTNKEKYKELVFIFDNISEEIFSKRDYICRVFSVDELITGVISCKNGKNVEREIVEELLNEAIEKIKEYFRISVTYVLTKKQSKIENLSNAFLELKYFVQYKAVFKIEEALCADSVQCNFSENIKDVFNDELERKFINNLSNGNVKNAIFILDTIFDRMRKSNLTIVQMKFIISDLSCSFYKISSDMLDEAKHSLDVFLNAIYFEENVNECYNRINAYINEICKKQAENNNASAIKRKKVDECLSYLKENYSNPNLNLNTISLKMDMDSGYLSRIFKENIGCSFTEFLTRLRVEHAKRALRETTLSVNVVSMESGFANLRTFNRVFKKQEGITPLEFRKSAF